MNAQEIFDTVARHLMTQGAQALRKKPGLNDETCAYRGDDGKKCAVGALIPDNIYVPEMDQGTDTSVRALLRRFPTELPAYFYENTDLLDQLQDVHDDNPDGDFRYDLEHVAEGHGLSTAVLEEFRP
jgi:hypothetical protein